MTGATRTYEEFVLQAMKRQYSYIRREQKNMNKAYAHFSEYRMAMAKLGIHPLTEAEISGRLFQLKTMEARINETHGDTPTMRLLYEDCAA